MKVDLVKKVSATTTTYLAVVNDEKVFYLLEPPSTPEAEYWNENIGVFDKYNLVEANVLKLFEPGCSETSWLELLVVRGITREDLEEKLSLMMSVPKDDSPI